MTAAAAGTSVLFYGHYDVQPVDPLELWDHDPFEPSIETRADGTKVIRRARRGRRQGPAHDLRRGLPRLEGGDRQAADPGDRSCSRARRSRAARTCRRSSRPTPTSCAPTSALICDTNMWDKDTPAITTIAARPLRRGDHHPRRRPRPAFGLLRLGRGEPQPRAGPHPRRPARRGRAHHASPASTTACRSCPRRCATAGRSSTSPRPRSWARSACRSRPARRAARALEMVWSRPTCEVNGMGGGYQGAGFKTVIPAMASAKISFRLVFDQDPHKVRAAFREFVQGAHAGRLPGRVHRARLGPGGRLRHLGARPSRRPRRRLPTNGARRRPSSAAAARSRSPR